MFVTVVVHWLTFCWSETDRETSHVLGHEVNLGNVSVGDAKEGFVKPAQFELHAWVMSSPSGSLEALVRVTVVNSPLHSTS